MYNHTGLQGRLTADPELRYTQQGTAITSFTLASDTGRKTKDGQINVNMQGKYSTVGNAVTGTYPDGVVTATMSAGKASGGTVSLTTADGGATWACGATTVGSSVGAAANTTIATKYLPNACKP